MSAATVKITANGPARMEAAEPVYANEDAEASTESGAKGSLRSENGTAAAVLLSGILA